MWSYKLHRWSLSLGLSWLNSNFFQWFYHSPLYLPSVNLKKSFLWYLIGTNYHFPHSRSLVLLCHYSNHSPFEPTFDKVIAVSKPLSRAGSTYCFHSRMSSNDDWPYAATKHLLSLSICLRDLSLCAFMFHDSIGRNQDHELHHFNVNDPQPHYALPFNFLFCFSNGVSCLFVEIIWAVRT